MIAPTAAHAMMAAMLTSPPVPAATPAVISAVSLGTSGKNASTAARPKTMKSVQFESPIVSRTESSSASGTARS